MDHRYQQFCALARATDVIGNRWTLLIIRELRPGPRRFSDLLEGLPGISRKLLSERLRDLERDGIIARRELLPPAARQVYELTEDGRDLAFAMAPLIAWGVRRLGERRPEEFVSPRTSAVGMVALADRDATKGVSETYQYLVGDSAFYFIVSNGSIEVRDGRAEDASAFVKTDEETWADIVTGKISASAAASGGTLTASGDRQALKRLGKIFSRDQMLAHATAASA